MRPMAWRIARHAQPALVQKPSAKALPSKRHRKAILVDGNNVLHHFFDPLCPLEHEGKKVGAIDGMFQLLRRLDRMHAPAYISVFFDYPNQPTVRKLMDPSYKSNRRPTPRELRPQMTSVPSLLEVANVRAITCPGIESDDIIASYANALYTDNYDVLIVSNDNDFLQLTRGEPPQKASIELDVPDKTSVHLDGEAVAEATVEPTACVEVYQMNKRRYLRERHVRSRFSVAPWQLPDYFALCGISWGKLPRVDGMTDEVAVELLTKYGTLPRLLRSLDEIEDATLRKTMKQSISSIESGYRISKLNGTLELPVPIQELATPQVHALPDLVGNARIR